MADFSDAPTLVDSDGSEISRKQASSLPPSNYLWFDPCGKAYPGWQHQLILQALVLDESWSTKRVLDFTHIRRRLRNSKPPLLLGPAVIKAVAVELVNLDEHLKSAFETRPPIKPPAPVDTKAYVSSRATHTTDGLNDRSSWCGVLDPALFEDAEADLTAELQSQRDTDFGNERPASSPPVVTRSRLIESTDVPKQPVIVGEMAFSHTNAISQTHVPSTCSAKTHVSRHSLKETVMSDADNSTHLQSNLTTAFVTIANDFSPPITPTKSSVKVSAPPRLPRKRLVSIIERNERFNDMLDSPSGTRTASVDKQKPPSVHDEVMVDKDNAGTYAPLYLNALVAMDYQWRAQGTGTTQEGNATAQPDQNIKMASAAQEGTVPEPITISRATAINTAQSPTITISRPDVSKYRYTSRSYLIVPASEAEAFIAWFDPRHDRRPDRIEGYFWYCDQCLGSHRKERGNTTRGKISSRRSVEKHFRQVHGTRWSFELPERERDCSETATLSVDGKIVDDEEDKQDLMLETLPNRERRPATSATPRTPEPVLAPSSIREAGSSSPKEAYDDDYKYWPADEDLRRTLFKWKGVYESTSWDHSSQSDTSVKVGFKDLPSDDRSQTPATYSKQSVWEASRRHR